ncbi:MAG: sigma 54-interacting transcriptional regulator [Bdellovibrionaceae bacterium]|nr:sigma 54-interacting transcriptional regulator [Pseudobdellovibrionaceae bacterium]
MSAFLVSTKDAQVTELQDSIVLGSDSGCGLRLSDGKVSSRHARLEKRDGGWLLRDLRSESGTWLNENRVLEAFLRSGDIIRVGDSELIFKTEQPQESAGFPMQSRNPVWQEELQSLGAVAKSPYAVLLLGPSGTGKDVLARKLHECSQRSQGPFLSVNCSAFTETLVESELFGHVKGSFTGALSDRKGAFEAARGGTLFLDEIGDLPYSLQAKLLRAIENEEVRPVGSDKAIKTDVRIIAATHQNLWEKIQEGSFRADLYYRLSVITVSVPALAHRMEDFETLMYDFAKKMRVRFSFAAIQRMKSHSWPGNIRELRNLVARASVMFPGELISESHIERLLERTPESPSQSSSPRKSTTHEPTLPVIKEIERQMIIKRLAANKGNQRQTAADLGMAKSTLHDRLKYYGINVRDFKV